MAEPKFEAVVVIVNKGFSDVIMDAAREAGCRGGTIIHARGTGHLKTEKEFGIMVTPDKEFILMVVKEDIKDAVMAAVNKVCGVATDGHGVVFSMPVTAVSGMKF